MSVFFSTFVGKKTDIEVPMPALIFAEEYEVDDRLSRLGLKHEQLLEILRTSFAEHGNCNENDPRGSHGMAVYRWTVRGLREQLRSEGWEINRDGGIETIQNSERKIRIAVLNTDECTCDTFVKAPLNKCEKGSNSERIVSANAQMFPGAEEWPIATKMGPITVNKDDFATWHFCIFIRGDELKAELSLLIDFGEGFFQDARERIFIVNDGEWGPAHAVNKDDDEGGADPSVEITIRRK